MIYKNHSIPWIALLKRTICSICIYIEQCLCYERFVMEDHNDKLIMWHKYCTSTSCRHLTHMYINYGQICHIHFIYIRVSSKCRCQAIRSCTMFSISDFGTKMCSLCGICSEFCNIFGSEINTDVEHAARYNNLPGCQTAFQKIKKLLAGT